MTEISVDQADWYFTGWSLAAVTVVLIALLIVLARTLRWASHRARSEEVRALVFTFFATSVLSLVALFVGCLMLKGGSDNWTQLEAALRRQGLEGQPLDTTIEKAKALSVEEYYKTATFVLLRTDENHYELVPFPQATKR